jgi:hypothetical protein
LEILNSSKPLYYLKPQLENTLTYDKLSQYLINIKANIILTDKELSLKIFKNL